MTIWQRTIGYSIAAIAAAMVLIYVLPWLGIKAG
jgi:hypothetical protein